MENRKTKTPLPQLIKSIVKARDVRPLQTAAFLGPVLLFFGTIAFLSIASDAFEGVTFISLVKALPISITMGLASYLSTGLFRLVQLKFPKFFSLSYFASFPFLALTMLAIRQVFPIGADRPEVWNFVGNQASFFGFILIFTFAFSQTVGNALDRLDTENKRANAALAELEGQHLRLIAAQEQVRKEIATSLHDGLQSNLVVLGLQMQNTASDLPEKYKSLASSFVEEIERLRRVDVRGAIRQLSPDLDQAPVESAIRELAAKYSKVMKIKLDFDAASSDRKLDTQLKLGIYRIVEQALLNAAAHGHAQQVSVSCVLSDKVLSLLVLNDGEAPEFPIKIGLGLSIIDGWCKVFSGTWKLTRVEDSTLLSVTLVRAT